MPTPKHALDQLVGAAEAALTRWNTEYGKQFDTLVGHSANRVAANQVNGPVQQHLRQAATGLEQKNEPEQTDHRSEQRVEQGTEERQEQSAGRRDVTAEIAEPTSSFHGFPYQWFDLIAVGPFQQAAPGGGPFVPSRVIRAGEPAVLLAAVWRNPFPLPFGPNPSAPR